MSDDDEYELPWPRSGDELFIDAPDWWMNACVNYCGGLLYALGYRTAGDALVERIANTRADQDSLVYPIVFCYRQYLELLLKADLREGRACFGLATPSSRNDPLNDHELMPLWQELRPLLDRRWPDGGPEPDYVEDALRQFDTVDRRSFAFRYPTDKRGRQSLPADMLRLNLRNLAEVVGRIGTFLEAQLDALDADRQAAGDGAIPRSCGLG
jgi:hypothetical protein